MKIHAHVLGCKVSRTETDGMLALLYEHGWESTEDPAQADAILLTSCTVTASGDSRMRRALRRLRTAAPHAVMIVSGCYVQAFPEQAAALGADILIGTRERTQLPRLLDAFLADRTQQRLLIPHDSGESFEELPCCRDAAHTRAFLQIQDGCERYCSYCIIPHARGASRSRSLDSIRAASASLYRDGCREVVLCGINLACFSDGRADLADAAAAAAASGMPRVRLGSIEPDSLTPDMLHRLAAIPAVQPHFHLCIQSGCDRTLRAMGRQDTCSRIGMLVRAVRSAFTDPCITADIITGFPGETDDDHAQTLEFLRTMRFSRLHVFRYSRRPGTPAAQMPGQIPDAVRTRRSAQLRTLSDTLYAAYLDSLTGRTLRVLIEQPHDPGCARGHAGEYCMVHIPGQAASLPRGSLCSVYITGRDGDCLTGICTDMDS